MMAHDAASAALGIELLDHGDGWARAGMLVGPAMVNGHGMCHGGLVFTLADTAFACACNSAAPATVAAECSIVFTAPARRGDYLEATARLRTRYGRNGLYDVTVARGEDVVAEFRGRSSTLAARVDGRESTP